MRTGNKYICNLNVKLEGDVLLWKLDPEDPCIIYVLFFAYLKS